MPIRVCCYRFLAQLLKDTLIRVGSGLATGAITPLVRLGGTGGGGSGGRGGGGCSDKKGVSLGSVQIFNWDTTCKKNPKYERHIHINRVAPPTSSKQLYNDGTGGSLNTQIHKPSGDNSNTVTICLYVHSFCILATVAVREKVLRLNKSQRAD